MAGETVHTEEINYTCALTEVTGCLSLTDDAEHIANNAVGTLASHASYYMIAIHYPSHTTMRVLFSF